MSAPVLQANQGLSVRFSGSVLSKHQFALHKWIADTFNRLVRVRAKRRAGPRGIAAGQGKSETRKEPTFSGQVNITHEVRQDIAAVHESGCGAHS
jgi:hypothetical protein